MDELRGVIGIKRAVQGETPALSPIYYVCELPGISLENITATADSDQTNVEGVWKDVEPRGIIRFCSAFYAKMSEKWKLTDRKILSCIIAENKELLAVSLWYLLGSELMVERVNSDRLNRFTTIDRKKAIELRDYLAQEFDLELTQAIASINPNQSTCIDCSKEIIEHLPLIGYRESQM